MGKIPYKIAPGKVAAGLALSLLLGVGAANLSIDTVADFEGYVPEAYQDPVGIWTRCYGDTTNVTPGAKYTAEECAKSLNDHLYETSAPIMACVPSLRNQSDKVIAAATSMAYNVGPGAFCRSSVARYFNAGDYKRGCERIAEIYKTAKGQELPGLVKRRKYESDMCLAGLREER